MKDELSEFLASIEKESKRRDCFALVELMEQESGYEAVLRDKIIGFGIYHYKYANGRDGSSIVTGFSPRSQNITIYIMPGFSDYPNELKSLGKFKSSKVCLYINKLSDIDESVLRKIIRHSVGVMQDRYECTDS